MSGILFFIFASCHPLTKFRFHIFTSTNFPCTSFQLYFLTIQESMEEKHNPFRTSSNDKPQATQTVLCIIFVKNNNIWANRKWTIPIKWSSIHPHLKSSIKTFCILSFLWLVFPLLFPDTPTPFPRQRRKHGLLKIQLSKTKCSIYTLTH